MELKRAPRIGENNLANTVGIEGIFQLDARNARWLCTMHKLKTSDTYVKDNVIALCLSLYIMSNKLKIIISDNVHRYVY